MLLPGIVYDGLAVTAGLAQGLFVVFGHVLPEGPKSTPLGRGGHSTFLVPPLGGVLGYSPGPGSSLGDSGIGCFENHIPNVLTVSVNTWSEGQLYCSGRLAWTGTAASLPFDTGT